MQCSIDKNQNKSWSSLQKLEEMYCIICDNLQINIVNYNVIIKIQSFFATANILKFSHKHNRKLQIMIRNTNYISQRFGEKINFRFIIQGFLYIKL